MALNLKGEELRAAYSKLRICLVEGNEDDAKIGAELGLTWDEVLELKRSFYDHEAEILRARSTEQTYVRFAIEQRQCMNDLDEVIIECKGNKNANVRVSANKAKSDISERMLKMGLELGVVNRISDSKGYAAGEAIKQMANPELRRYIIGEINVCNQYIARFGDSDMLSVEDGPIYRTTTRQKHPVKAHGRSKVYGGRRVVKGDRSSE